MLKVAIVGANGFIGSRIVEMLHLEDLAEVRPIVRSFSGLAGLSRFNLDCRIADAFDRSAIRTAFAGCDVVIHAVAGDRKTILETLAPTYQAAQEAGVRRLVYLSSASVHGQAPLPGTDEKSPLTDDQPLPYNNAKVHAEWKLLKLREKGNVELVMLRPGIVFGPRSGWVINFADALLRGEAYLINEGKGICNTIYIDNLVHAIHLAMTTTSGVDREAFLVGDQEQVTWADLYRPIAGALGFDLDKVPEVVFHNVEPSWLDRLEIIRASKSAKVVLSVFPSKLRGMVYAALCFLKSPLPPASPWELIRQQKPIATKEMALLYQCQYKLPFDKAKKTLGYKPTVSFAEGCRRSIAWLAFAGYPVIDRYEIVGTNVKLQKHSN